MRAKELRRDYAGTRATFTRAGKLTSAVIVLLLASSFVGTKTAEAYTSLDYVWDIQTVGAPDYYHCADLYNSTNGNGDASVSWSASTISRKQGYCGQWWDRNANDMYVYGQLYFNTDGSTWYTCGYTRNSYNGYHQSADIAWVDGPCQGHGQWATYVVSSYHTSYGVGTAGWGITPNAMYYRS